VKPTPTGNEDAGPTNLAKPARCVILNEERREVDEGDHGDECVVDHATTPVRTIKDGVIPKEDTTDSNDLGVDDAASESNVDHATSSSYAEAFAEPSLCVNHGTHTRKEMVAFIRNRLNTAIDVNHALQVLHVSLFE
jgi:hypothetical protein